MNTDQIVNNKIKCSSFYDSAEKKEKSIVIDRNNHNNLLLDELLNLYKEKKIQGSN